MDLPYENLTPIMGEAATYDPKTETTPSFMNGKFEELLENDKYLNNQINVLKENINEMWSGSVTTGLTTASKHYIYQKKLILYFDVNGYTEEVILYPTDYGNNFSLDTNFSITVGGSIITLCVGSRTNTYWIEIFTNPNNYPLTKIIGIEGKQI